MAICHYLGTRRLTYPAKCSCCRVTRSGVPMGFVARTLFISVTPGSTILQFYQRLPVLMTASRRPSRTTARTANPDSLRAAHEQITRNNGTLADIANLIEMEGKANVSRRQPVPPANPTAKAGSAAGKSPQQAPVSASRGPVRAQRLFGLPVLAILGCALILGTAVGIPLGVLTYGTELYSAVMDGLAIF